MALPAPVADDEELAGPAPGVPAAIPPPPVPGMPDMSGFAAPTTPGAAIPGQPPAPDMGAPTAALGPGGAPAPNAALGPDDLMAPAPGTPTPAPGAPGAPSAASAPVATLPNGQIDTVAEEKKALSEQAGLGNDAVDAEKKLGDINATNAAGVSTAADHEAAIAIQKQKDDEQAIATANQQTQGWITKAQQDAQKYQGMGLHDYWDHQSTGNKVLAGISVMFGAAGRTSGNPGLDQVNKAIDRDFEMQQQNIAKAKSNVETDNQMVQMGLTAKQAALADNNLKKAGALDATAAQLQSYLMKQGVPLAQAQTDKNVAALREKANATRMETLEKVHAQNVQDAHLGIEQENADSLRLRAEKYKTRGGKGAGGAGGSSDVQGLAQAIRLGVDDGKGGKRPLTYDEQLAAAKQFGVPPEAKAGHVSLTSVLKGAAFDANQAAKEAKAGGGTGAAADAKEQATRIRGVDGEVFGHIPNIGGRMNPQIAVADTRVGNAQALIKAFKELADDVKTNGNNLIPFTVASRNRDALIANIQAAKRVAEQLPASEGGLHLEEAQMPGSGKLLGLSTSPELIEKSIERIKDKVNTQNKAMVHDAPADGGAEPAIAPAAGKSTPGLPAPAKDAPGVAAKRAAAQRIVNDKSSPPGPLARAQAFLLDNPG